MRANALPSLSGTFLSMSLFAGQKAFEAVPWVRNATVQRVWPNRLRVKLETPAAAYWKPRPKAPTRKAMPRGALVGQQFREVFQANLGDVEDEELPELAGPAGSSQPCCTCGNAFKRSAPC
ncbi:cell division protein FtsQ/DivIB [Roseateles sp. GG27B]